MYRYRLQIKRELKNVLGRSNKRESSASAGDEKNIYLCCVPTPNNRALAVFLIQRNNCNLAGIHYSCVKFPEVPEQEKIQSKC
jgi:hypothetical protein